MGAEVGAEVVDVADEAAVRRWIESCDDAAHLDRVFANAGVATGEESEANVRRTFAINVGGTVNTGPRCSVIFAHGFGIWKLSQLLSSQ